MQNFILKSPSMWCYIWAEVFCGNVSWLEIHPFKISRGLGDASEPEAGRARFTGNRHYRRGPFCDTGRLAGAFLENIFMVVAWVEQNFRPIGRRLEGEPAF